MNNQSIWALLVGIDEYASPTVRTLRGCRNDVQAMRSLLRERLGVPARQIRVLANQEATRERILDEFGEFLIDNDEIAPDSQILFHYSGHGSQMPNTTGTEPDGRDETLVPHDSRVGDVFDIPDKTLAALIQRLASKRGQNITVVLDCCHSGSGTRALLADQAVVTRRAPFDERRPPLDLDATYRAGAASRNAGRSGWVATAPNHVLLAGCLDREESHEHWTGDVQHGALTFFLLRYLREMPAGATYADLIDYVRPEVNVRYPLQTPQCEGQRDRQVFGGAMVERSLFIPARPTAAGEVRIEAGVVHGMNVGTEVAIYPPMVTDRDTLPPPLATGRVTAVGATEATVVLDSPPSQPLPVAARARVTREAAANALLRVLLAGVDPVSAPALASVRAAIESARGQGKPSPYLEIVDDESQPFDVRVGVESGQFSLRDPQGKPLVLLPQDLGDQGAKTCTALESIARFRIVIGLRNQDRSQIGGKVALRLRRFEAGKKPNEMAVVAAAGDGALALEYEPERPERNRYVVEVENSSVNDVFAHVFILNPDYSIRRLYPIQGQNETLRAGASLYCLPEAGGSYLKVYLPGDHPGEERWDVSHDQLKLIVTTKPCDFEKLQQDALEVPAAQRGWRPDSSSLVQLLEMLAAGGATRFSCPEYTDIGEDWATVSLAYTVLRKSVVTALGTAKAALRIGDGLVLEKPQGFEGKISVAPLEQRRRGLADESPVKFPPGFERLSEVFAPVARAGTRGFGGEPLVLTLETDEASRALIAPDNPLRLKLSETAEDYLPIAFDGEDYLPVGFGSDPGTVDIVRLPRTAADGGQPTARGLGRAIHLFVFKKLGRLARDVGLRAVESSDTGYRYIPLDKHRFQSGDRVALLVHGFLSDTAWLARDVAPFLRREVLPYDHILTWDYETFGTSVERTGAELAAALRQHCGFGYDDNLTLHVYAHSMGTLVSRCLVEYAGGHDFVDRMVLAGPPNRGTTLASMSRGMTYLLAALLNGLGELPVAGAASWALKELYEHGHGWEDLETDSDLTRRINGLDTPNNVRYLVLAGDNTRNQYLGSRLARLAHKLLDRGLDTVFGERENDAVVPMSSMLGLRNGSYPLLESRVLPCDHFTYFALPEGRASIREWILRT